MALTKVSGGILDPGINVAGVVTATGFDGPFIGGSDGINSGIITATGLDVNGNGDISGNLVVGGNLTANGDFTTLNTTLREVEILHVSAGSTATAGIITQTGTGDILNLYDNTTEVFSVADGGLVEVKARAADTKRVVLSGSPTNTTFQLAAYDGATGTGAGTTQAKFGLFYNTEEPAILKFERGSGAADGALTINTNNIEQLRFLSNNDIRASWYDRFVGVYLNSDYYVGANFKVQNNERTLYIDNRAANGRGDIVFRTGVNQAPVERLTIRGDGGVGIGSTLPLNTMALDVTGSIRYSAAMRGATGSAATPSYAFYGDHDTGMYRGNGVNILSFATAGVERLKIDADGAVNIGKNPAQSTGTNTQNAILTLKGYPDGNESSAAILALIRGYDTTSASTDHTLGRIVFGDKQAGEYAFIEGEVEANGGSVGDTPGRLVFSTAPDGTSAPTEKLRISQNGQVCIGSGFVGGGGQLTIRGLGVNSYAVQDYQYVGTPSDDDTLAQIRFTANTSAANVIQGAVIKAVADADWSTTGDAPTRLEFHTAPDGSATMVNRMTITQDGRIGMHDSTPNDYELDIMKRSTATDANMRLYNNATGSSNDTIVRLHIAGTSANNYIYFGDGDDSNVGQIRYRHSNDNLIITTGAAERLAINSAGIDVTGEVAASQDYPDLRPRLDFNFAAEKKFDPRITYQREGPASFTDKLGKVVLVGEDVPRFDHNPSTGESKGLLMEATRINQWLYSEDLVTYVASNEMQQSTLTNTTATTDPTGGTNAVKMAATATSGAHSFYKMFTSGSNGNVHTASVWVKAAGVDYARLYVDTVGGNMGGPGVTFSTGNTWNVTASGTATQTRTSVVEYPNGWWRLSVSGSFSNQNAYYVHIDLEGGEGDVSFTGNGSNGMYVWGVQFELGTFPTSYIPTNGATATRGNEHAVIDGEDFSDFYNSVESSVLAVGTIQRPVEDQGQLNIFHIGDNNEDGHGVFREHGTKDVWYHIRNNNSTPSGGNLNPNGFGDWDAGEEARIAIAFKDGDQAISVNGGNQITATVTSSYPTADITKMWIGSHGTGSYFEGHIKRIAYYPKLLTDNQLNTLTA